MLAVPLVASLALLAGCTSGTPTATPTSTTNGVESKSAQEILNAAVDALGHAQSFHLVGETGQDPLKFGLDLVYAGDNLKGTVDYSGVPVNVVKVGSDLYVNAAQSFWSSALATFLGADQQALVTQLSAQLGGAWAKAPAAAAASVVPIPLSLDQLFGSDAVPAPLTKGDVGTLDGKPVVTFTDGDGSKFSVALDGQPYIVQIDTTDGPVKLSDFDAPVTIDAPTGAIDLIALLTGGGTG
jgi:hypothetical protein